jgi:ABC-type branched-subunit amino acid transport system ATPase component
LNLFDNVAIGAAWRAASREAMTGSGAGAQGGEAEAVLGSALADVLHRRAGDLPFVMQKQLERAVLMGKPRVVLLDEPAAGLNRSRCALDDHPCGA